MASPVILGLVTVFCFLPFTICHSQSCRTPSGDFGWCVLLTHCQALSQFLLTKPVSSDTLELLHQSNCGFENREPKVCCPARGSGAPDVSLPNPNPPEIPRPEPSLPEVSRPEPSLPEVTQPEPSLPEVSRPEPSLPEVTQPEPSLPEVSRPDTSLPEVSQPDTSFPETSRPDPSIPEVTQSNPSVPEVLRPDPIIPEVSQPEPSLPEVSRPEPSLPEVSRPEPSLPEVSRPDTSLPEVSQPDTSFPETSRPDPNIPEVTQPDPTVPEVSRPDPNIPEVSRPDPNIPEVSRPNPDIPEVSRPEPSIPEVSRPVPGNPNDLTTHPNFRMLPLDQCGISTRGNKAAGEASTPGDHPWVALLQYESPQHEGRYRCVGSLITARHVLTAAHCVAFLPGSWNVTAVRLGDFDLEDNLDCDNDRCVQPEDFEVAEIIPEPGYLILSRSQQHDIAVLRLSRPVTFTPFISPICLPAVPSLQRESYTGATLQVAGWGNMDGSTFSRVQREVSVTAISNMACLLEYTRLDLHQSQMCATGMPNSAPCIGDGGGPLTATETDGNTRRTVQVGILSIGPRVCGSKSDIYTRVSFFLPWILDQLN